jgi:hypothetical protein
MATTIVLLIILNLLLSKHVKRIGNHGGEVLNNIKVISKVYDYMKKILVLYYADRVTITKVSIEGGDIIKQIVHEVSEHKEPLTDKLKSVSIEHDEYVKIKRLKELQMYFIYINEIATPYEKNIFSDEGITHVRHIKLIDKVSTTYMLSVYFKSYDIKLSRIRKFTITLYLRIIRNIFRKNIDKL